MEDETPKLEWVLIPPDGLEAATLTSLIEGFVLREGTDYGVEESRFSSKVEQVRRQLEAGTISIVFDPETDSVTLLTETELKRRQKKGTPVIR